MFKMSQNKNAQIFVVSIFMLFLELFLVRWVSTEIRIFAYVGNLVLLACFVGIGVGCYLSQKKSNVLWSFVSLAVLILAVKSEVFRRITELLGGFSDSVIWFQVLKVNNLFPAIEGIVLTIFMFVMIAFIFIPLGQMLGNLFENHPQVIMAYSLNVIGSIAGVWLFSFFSFLYLPPWIWFAVSALLGFLFLPRHRMIFYIFIATLIFSFTILFSSTDKTTLTLWSPYQKLEVRPYYLSRNLQDGYRVKVNNVNYMGLLNISPEFVNDHPDFFTSQLKEMRRFNQYELPYMFKEDVKDVLIVGAGGGNDVAGALRQNVPYIDAVEIDPGIYKIGSLFHPEKPYQDKRVNVIIDDARSYFKKANKKYDLICFGLLDSHTLSSSYNNIRLDHYVYTLESFQEAKKLLKKDGMLSIVFEPGRPWIAARIYHMIKEAFEKEPLAFSVRSPHGIFGWGGVMYLVGNGDYSVIDGLEKREEVKEYVSRFGVNLKNIKVKKSSDDWPYLYVEKPLIPKMYLAVILSLLILFFVVGRTLFSRGKRLDFHFFFLGAAFLLLEFQNISKASLLFGSTWLVNVYMISSILLLILGANLVMYFWKPKNIRWAYYFLWLSVIVLYFLPLNLFNSFNYLTKATLIAIFLNIPIFFAGLIFIYSFNKTKNKNIAFGSNLLGAAVGGIAESLSFVTGIKSLLLLVCFFYFVSFLFFKRR